MAPMLTQGLIGVTQNFTSLRVDDALTVAVSLAIDISKPLHYSPEPHTPNTASPSLLMPGHFAPHSVAGMSGKVARRGHLVPLKMNANES